MGVFADGSGIALGIWRSTWSHLCTGQSARSNFWGWPRPHSLSKIDRAVACSLRGGIAC